MPGEEKQALDKLQMTLYFGYSALDAFIDSIKAFLKVQIHYDGDLLDSALKDYKGRAFSDSATWELYNKSRGEKETTELTIEGKKELRNFQKLCKSYGVDILIVQKPKDLDDIVNKANKNEKLTRREERIIESYTTRDSSGKYHAKDEPAVVAFGANDLKTIDRIVDELEAKTMTLEKRKLKAREAGEKIRNLRKSKEKNIKQEKGAR
jgi:vacuolar-type H+-ATPase subunit I/STV1